MTIRLHVPGRALLPGYAAALRAGWSPSTVRDLSGEHLRAIEADADAFLREQGRREGGTVVGADGVERPRLPQRIFWIADGEQGDEAFCGCINLRFLPGTLALPAHVSGHAGYSVIPPKRGRGVASAALALLLPVAREIGLPRILLTCDEGNVASARVIEKNGGVPAGTEPEEGGGRKRLFWVDTLG